MDKATIGRWIRAGKVAGAKLVNGVWVIPVESLEGLSRAPQGRKRAKETA